MHDTPWRQGYSQSAGGEGCTVVVVAVLVGVLPVVGGGSSSSPAASESCELGQLLLAVVPLSAVQVAVLAAGLAGGLAAVQVAVLAAVLAAVLVAVQVVVLAAVQVLILPVGGGSSPSPAASDSCQLGQLLLAVVPLSAVQVAVLAAVQVAVLAAVLVAVLVAVQVVVLTAVQVLMLPVGGGLQPFPCSLGWLPTGAAAADSSGACDGAGCGVGGGACGSAGGGAGRGAGGGAGGCAGSHQFFTCRLGRQKCLGCCSVPFLQEDEPGDGLVAAVEPVRSEEEEAEEEDVDNRESLIQQYFR
ncbi:hypothetical protein NDU88_007949 [Pleurodeles waltl]|uniref:Uncharacterized protein n=1 Tax=Pleurodeles waltl TaxID=8319 RepID=A0AAV7VR57_PLEWA|nr:hypothetical protein NDU88_007949 [Pleurodeles waltl]